MDRLTERLATEPFVILDGGFATELEARGFDLDDPLWSAKVLLDAPEALVAVHRSYLEAGADVITTASYQATIPGLCRHGLSEAEAEAKLRELVALARLAAELDSGAEPAAAAPLVAASIGSYGAYLADGSEYRGDYGLDRAALVGFHRRRLDVLTEAGPDLLAFETIPSALEAEAIVALLDGGPGPRAWISFSLRPDSRLQISDGTDLAEAIAPLIGHPRVAAVGINCVGPSEVRPALELLARVSALPPVVYPNSGERWRAQAWAGSPTDPAAFAKLAQGWIEAGARIVGGCCRTTPAYTRALASLRATSH